MNKSRKKAPRPAGDGGDAAPGGHLRRIDGRPLVLLVLGLVVLTTGLISRRINVKPRHDKGKYQYFWLTGSGIEAGLYRVPQTAYFAKLYDGIGLTPPREAGCGVNKKNDNPTVFNDAGHIAALRVENCSDPVAIHLPAGVASFFSLPVPINQVDKAILTTLPGIGPRLAGRIIAARDKRGGLHQPEDLLLVKGIGKAKLRTLRRLLSFE